MTASVLEHRTYIKKHWDEYLNLIKGDFEALLRICMIAVGLRQAIVRSHFRNAGILVKEPDVRWHIRSS